MKDWWLQRTRRERLVLQATAVFLFLVLLWSLAFQPMQSRREALLARIASQQATLQALAEARGLLAEARAKGSDPADPGGRSLSSIVEQGLRMAGLAAAIRRIEPAGAESVSVVLEQAPFDLLVDWLQQAAVESGVTVLELSLEAAVAEGTINARLRLSSRA